jgi:hypothetical protein
VYCSALILPLVYSSATTSLHAQTTAATGTSSDTAPAAGEPTLRAGEIRLEGVVRTVNAGQSSFVLDVTSISPASSSNSQSLEPKPRTILIDQQTTFRSRNNTAQPVTLATLAAGANAIVVGKDNGSSTIMTAREVVVEGQAPATSGEAVGPAATSETLTRADIDALLATQKQELTQQIDALRAEIQSLRSTSTAQPKNPTSPPPPTTTGGASNAVTNQQFNDALAALRREIGDELARLSDEIKKLKAAGAQPATPMQPATPAQPVPPPQ